MFVQANWWFNKNNKGSNALLFGLSMYLWWGCGALLDVLMIIGQIWLCEIFLKNLNFGNFEYFWEFVGKFFWDRSVGKKMPKAEFGWISGVVCPGEGCCYWGHACLFRNPLQFFCRNYGLLILLVINYGLLLVEYIEYTYRICVLVIYDNNRF